MTTSRRDALKTTAATVGGAMAASLNSGLFAAQGTETLKVGLVGCGGRGGGAAVNALSADPHTRLVALGDAFGNRLESKLTALKKSDVGDRVDVVPEMRFSGFDNFKHVADNVDVVLLATPPHFRPQHLRYAVEAGKHVFVEKPVAVDAPGIRSVLQSCEMAAKKNLSIVSGLCWRYHRGMRETFARVHDGTIGEITAMQCSYNSGGVWDPRVTRDKCKSEMEYQMRNWYYYTWLSGDFNVEQHVHSLDKMGWAMQDKPPIHASGSGGRQQRTEAKYGNIFDHFNIVYEYENGVKAFARCRHFRGCANDVTDHIFGTKGRVDVMRHRIYDMAGKEVWRFKGRSKSMYQVEHDEFFASIRSGKPINNGDYMSKSSMLGIMGRTTAYTGKQLSWDQMMNSKLSLKPPKYDFGELKMRPVAIPGVTPFV